MPVDEDDCSKLKGISNGGMRLAQVEKWYLHLSSVYQDHQGQGQGEEGNEALISDAKCKVATKLNNQDEYYFNAELRVNAKAPCGTKY